VAKAWTILFSLLYLAILLYLLDAAHVLLRDAASVIYLPWWMEVIAFAVIAGACGGVAAVVSLFELSDVLLSDKRLPVWHKWITALVLAIVGGSGGAIAFLPVLVNQKIIASSASSEASDDSKIILFSTSLVAGFLGTKLIKKLAGGLDPATKANIQAEVQKKTDQNDQQIRQEIRTIAQENRELTGLLLEIYNKLQEKGRGRWDTSEAKSYVDKLLAIRQQPGSNRQVEIFLGRLYDEGLRQPQQAIESLLCAITERKSRQLLDETTAALVFNCGGYASLIAMTEKDATKKEQLLKASADRLKESIQLDPKNRVDANLDDDYATLRNSAFWPC